MKDSSNLHAKCLLIFTLISPSIYSAELDRWPPQGLDLGTFFYHVEYLCKSEIVNAAGQAFGFNNQSFSWNDEIPFFSIWNTNRENGVIRDTFFGEALSWLSNDNENLDLAYSCEYDLIEDGVRSTKIFSNDVLAHEIFPMGINIDEDIERGMTDIVYDRFSLGNCSLVGLVVEGITDDGIDIGLSEDMVTTTVRSRMRASGMFTEVRTNNQPFVYININVVGNAFSTRLEFRKRAKDVNQNGRGYSSTWDRQYTGTHGQDAGYIISSLSLITDQFIDEYFEVNQAMCPN